MEIVVVGCKGFGKVHLESIKGMDISIVERDAETVKYCQETFQIRKVYDNIDDALRSSADIIDLVVPHNVHRDLSTKSMRAGKHVLLEKPIATSMEDAKAIVNASIENKKKFMVAEQYFFDPSYIEAKQIIREGKIGKIYTIIVRDQRIHQKPGWRNEEIKMGGGALIDGGIHYLDTLLNLGGDYSEVIGMTTRSGSTLSGEDTTRALFRFTNNSVGIFFYTWSYFNAPLVPSFEVVGEKGSMYEDPETRPNRNFTSSEQMTAYGDLVLNGKKLNVKKYNVVQREIDEFARSIKDDTPVPYDPSLAIRDLKAVLEIYGQNQRSGLP